MKFTVKIAWILALILTVIFGWTSWDRPSSDMKEIDLSALFDDLHEEAAQYYRDLAHTEFGTDHDLEARELRKEKWYFISRGENGPRYWSSNKLAVDSNLIVAASDVAIYQFGDDSYGSFRFDDFYALFRIANNGQFHERVTGRYPRLRGHQLDLEALPAVLEATVVPLTNSSTNHLALLLSALAITSLLFYLVLIYMRMRSSSIWFAVIGTMIVEAALHFMLETSWSTFFMTNHLGFEVFDRSETLVLLFVHLIVGMSILLAYFNLVNARKHWLFGIVSGVLLFFATDLLLDLAIALSSIAPISFDFEKIFGLTIHSYAALSFMCLGLIAIWLLWYSSKLLIPNAIGSRWWQVIIAFILFATFQHFDASRSFISLLKPAGLVVLSFIGLNVFKRDQYRIYAYFVFTAALASVIVYTGQIDRESRYVAQFADQLIGNKDENAELILRSIENQLAQEFLTPEDFENLALRKEVIENRIIQLYFSNYLNKYEVKLLSFDSIGQNVNQNSLFNYEYLNQQYNNNTERTLSDYFYQIKEPDKFYGYIAKYENCDLNGHNGATFILLQPRVVESEFLYPQIFANQASQEVVDLSDHPYALYFKGRLINQRGSYSYPLTFDPSYERGVLGYEHTVFERGPYHAIISEHNHQIERWIPALTFTLALLIPISLLISLLARWIIGRDQPISRAFIPTTSKYLSSRIQTSLTLILLTGLLLSVYIIIGFIRTNYNENLESQLLIQIKNIGTRVQDRVDLERKIMDPEQRTLILNDESNTHKVDINLFNARGELLGTTKPYLIEDQIIGAMMNPSAFTQLTRKQQSLLLIQEELEGSDYLSAYIPLFDGSNQVIAYLNTPYFAKNEVLNKQISSLVVNVLNIYFLLLLAGIVIAYIISKQIAKPLLLIREKISKTELLGQNELIVYERDDEIGQLVKQYNKMVLELQESANQLAESEREGAWREMAKQVAHEIKNPLTPMKLSIQHLQRAYLNGPGEKLDTLFKKTSKLLIEQIDSLSNMASEFSNFAKMPEDQYSDFNVSKALTDVTDLFTRTENVHIHASIEPDLYVHADEEQAKRVFTNLVKNAIQAIPDDRKGAISVTLTSDAKWIYVSVEDNGKGISPSNYKKVFVPNFSTKNSGMGLGLAICKKIVETAGGTIHFSSIVNKGTNFEVKLPRLEKN